MKILYQFESDELKLSDLPDEVEMIVDKKPLIFKPCAVDIQNLRNRLFEAEELLKEVDQTYQRWQFNVKIDEHFKRYCL